MKRALIVSTSTLAGLVAVLALNPDEATMPVTAAAGDATTGAPDQPDTSSGTFTGTAVQVRDWGVVQVEVTTADGRLTGVTAVQSPDWDHRSAMISSYSIPELVSQAIDAQSADIAGVSGATFTSAAFAESLQAALARAGLG